METGITRGSKRCVPACAEVRPGQARLLEFAVYVEPVRPLRLCESVIKAPWGTEHCVPLRLARAQTHVRHWRW